MSTTYEINSRHEVIPYTSGRKCTDTRAWRDATELEIQQAGEIKSLESRVSELEEKLDAAQNDWSEARDDAQAFAQDSIRMEWLMKNRASGFNVREWIAGNAEIYTIDLCRKAIDAAISQQNSPVHPMEAGCDESSDHDSHDETTYLETP